MILGRLRDFFDDALARRRYRKMMPPGYQLGHAVRSGFVKGFFASLIWFAIVGIAVGFGLVGPSDLELREEEWWLSGRGIVLLVLALAIPALSRYYSGPWVGLRRLRSLQLAVGLVLVTLVLLKARGWFS